MHRVLAPIEQTEFEPVRLAELSTVFLGIAARHAKDHFGSVVERSAVQPVVVTRYDRPVAFVLSPEMYLSLVRDRERLETMIAIERALAAEKGIEAAE
jgi:PHD/YefM family antitoxin component YafN of YafNO toxin-antitoxin module